MRQILINSKGAVVARMPRPPIEAGNVLVRTHYSMVSVGTELAPLRTTVATTAATPVARAKAYSNLAYTYLGKALRNPDLAVRRAAGIARQAVSAIRSRRSESVEPSLQLDGICWTRCAARRLELKDRMLHLVTDDSEFAYQGMSQEIEVPPGRVPVVEITGRVHEGAVSMGLLNQDRSGWLGHRRFDAGPFEDQLIFKSEGSAKITFVIANAGAGMESRLELDSVRFLMMSPEQDGLPLTDLEDQGWNVGYSASGEVVAVGSGIADLAPGDRVACAGAGKANHAEYVSVPRNLVCKIPDGCDLKLAATTTVGAIGLQGVRRAAPQLGETICVLGMGLIGQLVVQMLCANGCRVVGFDPDAKRVARAIRLGMENGAALEEQLKVLVRDLTGARGVDRTIVAAATKSDSVINLAMEVTRAKGVVVIVGDVGLNVRREIFYRKEIDLLMSTSYGPGRYDRSYEEEGKDYPFAYVRWTLNRNMQAYMNLIASGRMKVESLIDRITPLELAPDLYRELAENGKEQPLGVLIRYPADSQGSPEESDTTRIEIRGHKKPAGEAIRYALVGVGAFGTSMLVPTMQKTGDRFHLRGLVSRNAAVAGNFARTNRVEILASDLEPILGDPDFDLIVIATRHHEHAGQVVRALQAGKHVFVEKPLATSWDELETVRQCYETLPGKQILMVGFNRRFSPALQTLKGILEERRSPLMISYRLNGGYIPPDSWIQGAQGGGRNIGEACHMYDVFRFLAGAPVTSIAASAIDPGSLPYFRNDNFAATITYDDGSVGNLVYTALGPKQGMPKERIEVFCDGEAHIVDDYKSLIRASDGKVLWQNSTADKGHFEELRQLGEAIVQGGDSPVPFQQLTESTAVALHVEHLLHIGEGAQD